MNLAQVAFNGLVSGMVIALPALALSLIFGILRFPNFAIGAMLMTGAYAAYAFNALAGFPLALAAPLGALAMAAIAVAMGRLVFEPLRDRGSITLLVASMGAAFVLENLVRFAFGNDVRSFTVPVARPFLVLDLRVNHEQIVTAVTALACMLAVHLLLRATRLGRSMRAVADNPDLAAVRGVDRRRVHLWVWGVAGALAGVAGILVGLDTAVDPNMGWHFIVPVFAAAILGGIGDPFGAIVGALVLGVVGEMSTLVLPAHYRSAVAFAVMVALLLVRPWGLFGRRAVAK